MNFDVAGLLGGIIHEDRKPGGADFTKEDAAKRLGVGIQGNEHLGFLGDEFERKTVKSLCFPLLFHDPQKFQFSKNILPQKLLLF